MFSASPPSQSDMRTLTATSAQLQDMALWKWIAELERAGSSRSTVTHSAHMLLKSIVLNTWQHTFPWSPFGQEMLSGHPGRAAGLGRLSGQNSGLYWSHGQSLFWLQQSQDFSVTLSLHFLAFNITAYFLSNFRQTYFSLLTKIFMMNSNYSVVVVSWDLIVDQRASTAAVCGCIINTGWVFIYVWCSLPYPQTLTWRSLNWEVNTEMWIESLIQDVPGLQTAKAR